MLKGPMQIGAASLHVTTSGTRNDAVIPNGADEAKAAWVMISCSTAAYYRPQQAGEDFALNTCALITSGESHIVNVLGYDEIANYELTTGAILVITPLDNQ